MDFTQLRCRKERIELFSALFLLEISKSGSNNLKRPLIPAQPCNQLWAVSDCRSLLITGSVADSQFGSVRRPMCPCELASDQLSQLIKFCLLPEYYCYSAHHGMKLVPDCLLFCSALWTVLVLWCLSEWALDFTDQSSDQSDVAFD